MYAKNGLRTLTKPVVLASTIGIASLMLSTTDLKAQADTTYADITVQTLDAVSNNPIEGVEVTLRPEAMQMVLMDTTYTQTSDVTGNAPFVHIPMHIDTLVSIVENYNKQDPRLLTNTGGEINISFPKPSQGTIEMYSLTGQLVRQTDFSGMQAYMPVNDLAHGMYIFRAQSKEGDNLTGKFLNTKAPLQGKVTVPKPQATNSVKATSLFTADFWVIYEKAGYEKDSILQQIVDGNNGTVNVYLDEIPPSPQGVDLKVHTVDVNNNPLENVIMVLQEQVTSSIDTIRSDANGLITFIDLPLGKTYTCALGGKAGYDVWEGFQLSTPSVIVLPSDTIMERSYNMISDTLHSNLHDIDVAVSVGAKGVMFANHEIQNSLYDTARAYFDTLDWTPAVIAALENEQQILSQAIGIPIVAQSTPFQIDTISNYDPFTTNPLAVGTNFVHASNVTYPHYYTFNSGKFAGDFVIAACDSIGISGNLNSFHKEHFRWFGADDVSSRPSVMNSTASAMNDIDAALINLYYHLGRNRYQFETHDLPDFTYLRETITMISVPIMSAKTTSKDNYEQTESTIRLISF